MEPFIEIRIFLHSNSEDEDVAPLSAKLTDIYSFNNFDNVDIVRNVDGIHSELNGGIENMTLKYEVLLFQNMVHNICPMNSSGT